MATVNKNFRIKNGLVVEGSTATVNGQNILTETGSDTYILNLIGGETLVKSVSGDFTVSQAGELQINNSSDLARTGDITSAINALDTDAIEEGTTNKYYHKGTAEADIGAFLANASKENIAISYDPTNGLSITAENGVADSTTDDLDEGSTNKYFTEQRARDSVSDGNGLSYNPYTGVFSASIGSGLEFGASAEIQIDRPTVDTWYDAAGAASTAEGNANTYTDNAINALDTDDIEEGATNKYYSDSRARAALSGVGGVFYDSSKGEISLDSTIATQSYVNNAIDNLVDGAPGLLDTLNEIAAAINDDENYFTTVTNAINAKQDALTAGSNIDITSNTISVTGLDTDDVAEGTNLYFTDGRARAAVDATDRNFSSVSINNWVKQASYFYNMASAGTNSSIQFPVADYKSAEFFVQLKNGSHTQISKVLLTLDTSGNIHMTEYGTVSTNGSLGSISAETISAKDPNDTVALSVTVDNANTQVYAMGTLLV